MIKKFFEGIREIIGANTSPNQQGSYLSRDTERVKEDFIKEAKFVESPSMVKKSIKRKAKDERADDILEEVLSISGSPGSPSKVGNDSIETDLESPSCSSVDPVTPTKTKKQGGSPGSSKNASAEKDKDEVQETPPKAKKAKRETSPATPIIARKLREPKPASSMKIEKGPAIPTKAKAKKDVPKSPTRAKKEVKEDKPASPDKAKSDEKNGSPKTVKKIFYTNRTPVKGLPKGWTRKAVPRKSGKTAGLVDVYFFAPDGTKLRSKPDIAAYLKREKLAHNMELFVFKDEKKITPKKEAKKVEAVKQKGKAKEVKKPKESKNSKDDNEANKAEGKEVKEEKKKEEKEAKIDKEKGGKKAKVGKKINKAKASKKVEDSNGEDPNEEIAENGEEAESNDEKEVPEKGTKVVIQVKPLKKKRSRK